MLIFLAFVVVPLTIRLASPKGWPLRWWVVLAACIVTALVTSSSLCVARTFVPILDAALTARGQAPEGYLPRLALAPFALAFSIMIFSAGLALTVLVGALTASLLVQVPRFRPSKETARTDLIAFAATTAVSAAYITYTLDRPVPDLPSWCVREPSSVC